MVTYHLSSLGWSPTNPRMVTSQKEVHFRLEIWHLGLTHKTTANNCHECSPTIPRMVTHHLKYGQKLSQKGSPIFQMMVTNFPQDGQTPSPWCSPTIQMYGYTPSSGLSPTNCKMVNQDSRPQFPGCLTKLRIRLQRSLACFIMKTIAE